MYRCIGTISAYWSTVADTPSTTDPNRANINANPNISLTIALSLRPTNSHAGCMAGSSSCGFVLPVLLMTSCRTQWSHKLLTDAHSLWRDSERHA